MKSAHAHTYVYIHVRTRSHTHIIIIIIIIIITATIIVIISVVTPAQEDVVTDVVALREDGDDDEGVEVEALHKDPEAAGRPGVVEGHEQQLALPVLHTPTAVIVVGWLAA